ncbi:hypothetical protein D8674_022630 [Pyrus ussuriensis x Pyrus communis]|uniref:Epstein-Barr nuclear antigen 2 n=1 Tax=Pyrus ussuriensis x Pyrus communis TaxID=2448454 RepID=A0A5N5GQU9_9ROSA|nr:hypothetical protein D8674_022630 [Pyrus ussuriensis x Pyrus communis]
MSVERSFEAWEEVQRHGQDLADRLTQGFTGLIQSHITPPSFHWPSPNTSKLFDLEFPNHSFGKRDFVGLVAENPGINGVSAILDIGNRIGQAGADFGACLNGMVHQFFRTLPVPFRHDENVDLAVIRMDSDKVKQRTDMILSGKEDLGPLKERLKDFRAVESDGGSDGVVDEELGGLNLRSAGVLGRPLGTVNTTTSYDTRTHKLESSFLARGDLWRVEASSGSSTSRNDNSSLFLVQLGPVLFVRDATLLLPVHLSKQHLLWYGYDKKNGMHSLCPAVWSKHRRWLLMSMVCLKPLACSFVDLQFPNGQFTYISGEGLSTSAFLPLCGGLLQAQGQYPGEMRFSFSRKSKWGTRITPVIQWPDKSFTLGLSQALAWQRSGLMVRPTIQFSLCPTFGGSNPGLRAELIHSVKEQLNLICGCAFTAHPSAFASVSVGRSKWNGNVGDSGIVLRVDTPLSNVGRPYFSIQLNNVLEF